MEISKLDIPSKGKINNYFIAGDWHSENLHESSLKILLSHAMMLPKEQRVLIINGDFLDCEHFMKRGDGFKKWSKIGNNVEQYFLPLSEDEFKWGNETLDRLQEVFARIIFIYGNHDWRYEWYKDLSGQCPLAYKHNFDVATALSFDKRGIDYVRYNEWLDIGSLSITHGMYHGSTCHKKHYEVSGGRDVIFSHIHRYECKAFPVRGKTIYSQSLPAMCDLNPEYIKNTENNWSNGYGQFFVFDDGSYSFNVHIVNDNKLILPDGTIFSA